VQEAAADDWATADARKLDLRVALASAFAPKADLQGRLVDSSVEGFLTAMDISCHSFVRMAKPAEPLMTEGGFWSR
jgi:enoyl-[acyl-carrier protein] reductase I